MGAARKALPPAPSPSSWKELFDKKTKQNLEFFKWTGPTDTPKSSLYIESWATIGGDEFYVVRTPSGAKPFRSATTYFVKFDEKPLLVMSELDFRRRFR